MTDTTVAVVGAGLAGLSCARQLDMATLDLRAVDPGGPRLARCLRLRRPPRHGIVAGAMYSGRRCADAVAARLRVGPDRSSAAPAV